MCSSPRRPNKRAVDVADRLGSVAGWGVLLLCGLLAYLVATKVAWTPSPGETRIHPETVLQLSLVSMPEIQETPPPELAAVVRSEPVAEPTVVPEPEPAPKPGPSPREEEIVSSEAIQPELDREGGAGREDAIRAEWLGELRWRIEQSKYYPGAARYSREAGTVWVRVEIGADGKIGPVEILKNTGSDLLAEGARGILRRAAANPLGTNTLTGDFRVDVPITYRLESR